MHKALRERNDELTNSVIQTQPEKTITSAPRMPDRTPVLTLLHQQDGHPDQQSPEQRVFHVIDLLVFCVVSSGGK